jgi:DNA-directed RNA polymerase specialized sigma subunit
MWLCRAAAEYDRNQAQFETYAQVVVKNGLLSYCKKIYNEQKNVITMSEICSYSDDNIKDIADCAANNVYDEFVFDYVVSDLFETVKFEYKGVTRLGIEALELKFKGYTGVEIAQLWGVEQNHIGAWISRAKKKLRQNKKFISAFQA